MGAAANKKEAKVREMKLARSRGLSMDAVDEPLEAIDAAEIATVAAYSDRFRESTKAKCDTSVELYPRFLRGSTRA